MSKETKWLCENARSLERYSGQWVLFNVNDGVVRNGSSIGKIIKASKKIRSASESFVMHVPPKEKMTAYVSIIEAGGSKRD